jgi:protein-S-isoprenylcysteine O-methyltransferase Ste14
MHKIPAIAKIASNPGTGGAVVLLAACRKLVTPAAVVVALVVAAVVVALVVAATVVAFAVTFAVSCAIDGRLKTSINKSAKTLLITIFFILIDHPLYIQTITRLAERHNTAPIYQGGYLPNR